MARGKGNRFDTESRKNALPGYRLAAISSANTISAEELRGLLLAVRKELGWSQGYLAAGLGVTSNTLARWEHGSHSPCGYVRRLVMLAVQALHTKESERRRRKRTRDAKRATRE